MAAVAEWFWGRYRRNYVTAVAAFT
ncbi:MAG: hypothetical protein QOF21_1253, partial [Actinomycetota bacterium]